MKNSTIFIVFMATIASSKITPSDTKNTLKKLFSFSLQKSEAPKSERERLLSLTNEDLYNERMKIVALERSWLVDIEYCSRNTKTATPTITSTDIFKAYNAYEKLEADWIDAHAMNASLREENTPSNNSFFASLINSPLFKSKK
ncbi:MAG: hypothetical protein NTU89_01565 [Candidatus Dependentiae bacterium]|nr:hypothetical protein [Candidatus Dependentiae bacterium]